MKFSLAQLALHVMIFGAMLGALLTSNLPFVLTVSSSLFILNLIGAALAVGPKNSRAFWMGFTFVSWGTLIMGANLPAVNAATMYICSSHGYTVNIQPTQGFNTAETYFLPFYPSGATILYGSLVTQSLAFVLGLVGGTIASKRRTPLTMPCTPARDDVSLDGQSPARAR